MIIHTYIYIYIYIHTHITDMQGAAAGAAASRQGAAPDLTYSLLIAIITNSYYY